MAALRAAKQAMRREIKKRVAALDDQEKLRQSRVISQRWVVLAPLGGLTRPWTPSPLPRTPGAPPPSAPGNPCVARQPVEPKPDLLFKHPKYARCERIAVFLSMHDEVRTEEIIQDLFKHGKTCFMPKYLTQGTSNHMDMVKLTSMEDMMSLPLTSWNIRQPAADDNTREEALETG
ncbi:5-formyltetrahydrofolate cyclo-ligase-like [Oncorhynchus keta]|uniref:5-formyltetrahydrofolate cyclo-ligase-like n=1 Tax=Oncorhynchus keta TaxID=8018 RepID=UPI00227A151C|nr:5-formyltetrahydrofolate cyclo-ligase-like [Oncorhynchus keta]